MSGYSLVEFCVSCSLKGTSIVMVLYICRPNEDIRTVVGFVRDRLAGARGLHLHWVAHQCNNKVKLHIILYIIIPYNRFSICMVKICSLQLAGNVAPTSKRH